MALTVLFVLVGLELKHYAADYLLQPSWLLGGKGDLAAAGGYIHAGIHVLGTAIVLLAAGIGIIAIALICLAEFFVHYAIDYVKYRYGRVDMAAAPWRFWALHGFDQMLHQLTYAGIMFAAMLTLPFG